MAVLPLVFVTNCHQFWWQFWWRLFVAYAGERPCGKALSAVQCMSIKHSGGGNVPVPQLAGYCGKVGAICKHGTGCYMPDGIHGHVHSGPFASPIPWFGILCNGSDLFVRSVAANYGFASGGVFLVSFPRLMKEGCWNGYCFGCSHFGHVNGGRFSCPVKSAPFQRKQFLDTWS